MTARPVPWIAAGLWLVATPVLAAVTSSPLYSYESDKPGRALGLKVATAGDVNGDGFSDVIAMGSGPSGEPLLHLFLGGASGPTLAPGFPIVVLGSGSPTINAAGDLNGDGYDDVVVGSPTTTSGEIKIFYGSASGLSTTPVIIASAADDFGEAVGTAGDVNGDGYADLIVGAPLEDVVPGVCGSGLDAGRVDVYYGSATGVSAANVWTLLGCQWTQTGGQLGLGVGTAGDVNGDGYDDIIVGAPFDRSAGPTRGAIWVVYGSASGLPLGANGFGTLVGATKRQPTTDQTAYGIAVITAGDVNGDGYADVAIGAPGDDTFATDGGMVTIFRGSSTGLATGPAFWTVNGTTANANLGATVTPAGDVNGDGLADLLIGEATQVDLAQSLGTTMNLLPPVAGGLAQPALSTAGDLDGDGLSDVVVGNASWSNGEANEGRIMIFAGRGDGPEITPSTVLTTGLVDPGYGWSVAAAGDVNGDGFDDVLVGAPTWDNSGAGETDNGIVALYEGSSSGALTLVWAAFGSAGDQVGIAVSAAGDVNGDGYADVIAGAHAGGVGVGKALVWYGHPTGPAAAPDVTLVGPAAGSEFGAAVGWGDFNGDGYADVVVGAPTADAPGPLHAAGRAFAYLGGPGGLATTPAWSGAGTQADANYGLSVAADGDITGDGFTDLVVGEPGYDIGAGPVGRVVEYDGGPGLVPLTFRGAIDGSNPGEELGYSMAHAGDVNGDGRADIIAGAPLANGQGRASVYAGSAAGLVTPALWTQFGPEPSSAFGSSVAGAGDVDGDGRSDVVVGAVFEDAGGAFDRGSARVYLGPLAPGAPAAWTLFGAGATTNLGHCVANAGDVNADGWSDLVFGEPGFTDTFYRQGRVELVMGARHLGRLASSGAQRLGGSRILPLGRTDPAQLQLAHLARSAAGRTRVRMEWRLSPVVGLAAPDRSGHQAGFTVTGVPGATGSVASLVQTVGGLTTGIPYAWRTRDRSRSPYFPFSTWVSSPINGAREYDLRAPGSWVAVGEPPAPALAFSSPRPNPARTSSRVRFVLPAAGHARLDILDVQGRRVRRLVDDDRPAGPCEIEWDGRRDDGTEATAGVYFYHLDAAGARLSRRLALLR
jgi:hypothetical protein